MRAPFNGVLYNASRLGPSRGEPCNPPGTDREERYERVVVASLRALAEALRVGEAKAPPRERTRTLNKG